MASYNKETCEYDFKGLEVQYGLGLAFKMVGKYPAVTKRIFDTLQQAQDYVDNYKDSAVAGLVLTVVGDTEDKKNGTYLVKSIASESGETGTLVRLATADEMSKAGDVTISAITATSGAVASYALFQDGIQKGATIDIPKDYLVKKAELRVSSGDTKIDGDIPSGHTYIDFTINTSEGSGTETHIRIDVDTLLNSYTAASGATEVQVAISKLREISATLVDSGVTTSKIATAAVTETKIADSAVATAKIANSAVTTDKIADKNVTNAKIADATIAREKIDASFEADVKALENSVALLESGETAVGSVKNAILSAKTYTDTKIGALGGDVTSDDAAVANVEVKTASGQVTDVIVTNISAGVTAGGEEGSRTLTATSATGAVVGGDIATIKSYVDNVVADNTKDLAVSATGDSYVSAEVKADNNKKVIVSTNVSSLTSSTGSVGVYDAEGKQTTAPVDPSLTGTANTLVDGADAASNVKTYVDGKVAIEAARADAKVLAAVKALDKDATATTGTNVTVTISETDGIASIDSVAESYATITRTATTSTSASPKTDAALVVTSGDEGKLVKASDLANVASYAADKVTEEKDRVNALIDAMDLAEVGGTGKVITTISEADGKVSATAIDLKAANVAATSIESSTTTVAVTGETVENQIASIAKTVKAVEDAATAAHTSITTGTTTDGHLTVTASTTEGKTNYTITTSDIASAALLGTSADTKDAKTAFGYIAKEADDRATAITNAIEALDVATIGETGKFIRTVSEVDGKISATTDTVNATEVAYTKNDDDKIVSAATTAAAAIKALDTAVAANKDAELTYKVVSADTTTLGANVREAYNLVSVTTAGTETKAGETIKIYKDSTLQSAEYTDKGAEGQSGKFLKLVYITVSGTTDTVYIDMSQLVTETQFKDGLKVVSGQVYVQIDSETESYLTVSSNGVKLSGIDAAIAAAAASATTVVSGPTTGHVTVSSETATDGHKIYTIATDDIASATALTQEIADRKAAISSLTKADTAVDGQYVSQVSESEGIITVTRATLPTLSVSAGSENYLAVNNHAVGAKVAELGDAVGMVKGSDGKWSAATGTAKEGLASAADVATEIVNDEEVVAAALNDHEDRIKANEGKLSGLSASTVQAAIDNVSNNLKADKVAATAITSSTTTVAVTGETVAAQIASLGQSIKTAENNHTVVAEGNGITVTTSGVTATVAAKVKENDPVLEVTSNGIAVKDDAVFDCGEWS